MINSVFDHDRCVVVQFPRFSGGKFLINCLSLSRWSVPQNSSVATKLFDNPCDYNLRFDAVMSTLPSKDDMEKWIEKYEFGDTQLFGTQVIPWNKGVRTEPDEFLSNVVNHNFFFFLVAHYHPQKLLDTWPNAKVIVLVNHTKFSTIAKRLKSPGDKSSIDNYSESKYNELAGPDWPAWDIFMSTGFDLDQVVLPSVIKEEMSQYYPCFNTAPIVFDVDSCLFDREKFLRSMSDLYQKLGFDDFNQDLIGKFWQAYMSLHVDLPVTL